MLAKHYAQALQGVQNEEVADNLLSVLKKKGHTALLPKIISEYEKLLEAGLQKKGTVLRVKNKEDVDKLEGRLSRYENELSFDVKEVDVIEDASIVGGFVIEQGEYEVDGSYRARLIELHRKIMAVSI